MELVSQKILNLPMELHVINGFLGSGKTTAIIAAAKILIQQGKIVGVVTNDKGQFQVDNAFFEFEEQYGNPDLRLAIVSLRDDVFRIPIYDEDNPGVALPQNERNRLFVEKLTEGSRSDGGGYLISFNTQLDHISPLTRNHKINYIEAEFQGDDLGDEVGRLYLIQRGTGTVHAVNGDKIYYRFPPRAAVINAFFNGDRSLEVDIDYNNLYANKNLRDRPLINTEWQLIFDPVGEWVNQDIAIEGISDVRLYFYYNDYTSL